MARILLVEDHDMIREMLSERLKNAGYQVLIAVDGAQGVALAQSETPDLILMDMGLPVLDGWQATRQIKAASQKRPTPIIALTAHVIAGEREKCLAVGCDDYVSKPVDFPQLLTKIQALLAKK